MSKLTLFIVPHTHYDAEVFLTRDTTLRIGADNLLDALHLLDRIPEYRYVLDQRCYLEGFVQLHPEELDRLRGHVASGRLELVAGMHTMPDVNMASGESFVRQSLYGRSYFEDVLGSAGTTGWMLDSFGHHPQMPQLLRKTGCETYVFSRGPGPECKDASFWWVGIDGSRIRAEWLPHTYALLAHTPPSLPAMAETVNGIVGMLDPYLRNGKGLVVSGMDLSAPEMGLPEMVRRFNASQHDVELVLATPSQYFAAQPANDLPEIEADLNPFFTGCYASRIALKQHNRRLENALLTAEKLVAVNWADGAGEPDTLEDAWEAVLFNQFHDLLCGSHLDEPDRRALERYAIATSRVRSVTNSALDRLIARVDTRGEGLPLVVFNPLGFARTDVARVTLSFAGRAWTSLTLHDPDGTLVPLQLENVVRHPDGTIKRADLLFIADVPSLGYRTFHVRDGDGAAASGTDLWFDPVGQTVPGSVLGVHAERSRMGNDYVQVHADLRSGAITSLVNVAGGWDVVDRDSPHGFGAVCRQEDRGDPWRYYGPLQGTATASAPFVDPVPAPGAAVFSTQFGGVGSATGGPVAARFEVRSPFGEGSFATTIRIYAGLPRVDVRTEVVNTERFVRYRKVFPLQLNNPRITYEIPFGAIDRPEGEYPAQNWVDVRAGGRGVAVLNRGVPGHSLVGSELSVSLLKCTRVVHYAGGGYDPRAADQDGFEIGVTHRFDHALLLHEGDWRRANLPREALAFNVPLIVRKSGIHNGTLPASASLVDVEGDHVLLHALYVDDGELVLRVADALGEGGAGRIGLRWPVGAVSETDLIARDPVPVAADEGGFAFTTTPFEIKTFRVSPA